MKYRKKPVVIEATQWWKHGDHPAVKKVIVQEYVNGIAVETPGANTHWHELDTPEQAATHGWIRTLEGGHVVSPGDWIITGVKGEQYPCKPDIFELTYEPAE